MKLCTHQRLWCFVPFNIHNSINCCPRYRNTSQFWSDIHSHVLISQILQRTQPCRWIEYWVNGENASHSKPLKQMSAYMCQLPYPFCIQIDTHTTHTYKRHPFFPHRLSTSPLNFWRNSDRICCILGRSMAEMITSRFKLFPMQKQKQ